jgi:hypothetical protein
VRNSPITEVPRRRELLAQGGHVDGARAQALPEVAVAQESDEHVGQRADGGLVAGEHDVGDVADELVLGQVEAADVGVELGEPGGRGDVGGGGEPGHLQGQERAGQRGEAGRVGEGQAGEPRDGAGGQGADEPGEQAGGLGVREQLAEELGRVLGDERLHLPEPPGGERGGHRRAEPPVQVAVGPDQRVGPQGTVEVVHRAGFGGQVRREPVPAAGGEAMRVGEHLLDLGVPGDGPPADGRDNATGDSRRMSARTPKGFSTVALPGPTRADAASPTSGRTCAATHGCSPTVSSTPGAARLPPWR